MQLFALSILATLLAATGAHAQSCATVPNDVASQLAEMEAFNNRVPAPSSTSLVDCTTGKNLKSGIDAYRNALVADPASGCIGVYANLILVDGFNPQYTTLGKFVAACGSL
ncbi:hypothetical protein MSAN_01117400 [Mycena sanguinolenta]|uniref:Uncharacterized protein n=1 Tax=Mycena sanguinolenta TaxID=230812 RepID=A0A8H6YLM0_9AGAR|nr:hypothetical protein MSAN_01117400 [Mycena sanguinolenta]